MTDIKPAAIVSLEDAADYLRQCRARKLTTGGWSFEAHNMLDRTGDLRSFFQNNPQHRISLNGCARFVGFSERALARLNEQLPEPLQIDPAKPVKMADKFR